MHTKTETRRTPQGATLEKRNLLSRGFFVWYRDQRLGHVTKIDGTAWQAYNEHHWSVGNPHTTAEEAADDLVHLLYR